MKKGCMFVFAIAMGLLLVSGGFLPVYAQESADEFMLEEITVTAEKREENVQKTAIAITAVTGADIRENGQVTLESVLQNVPALQVERSPQGGQIYIRGVGANGDSNWVDPSVAITKDGVYTGRAESVFSGMFDMDRVEVLRGPQGTLYGRNATGGGVNVVTKNPGDAYEAIANLQVGNYNLLHFDGAVNVPVSDTLAMRVAALRETRDGYFSNGGMESNLTAARLKVLYEPTEALTLLLSGDYSHVDQLDTTTVAYEPILTDPPPFFLWGTDPDDPWYVDALHPADEKEETFKTVTLKVDYDFGWATATVIPAYTHSNRYVVTDLINGLFVSPEDPPLETLGDGTTMVEDQYTVEARLASPGDSDLKWVFGTYYLATKNQPSSNTGGGGAETYETYGNNRPVSSWALFGQATYPLTDTFRLTGGLRYTKDDKSIDYGIRSIYGPEYDTGLITVDDGYSAVTFKAGVEYDVSDASMLYAQISSGYKAGGFNTSSMPPTTYEPEKLLAYEIGSKSRFFSNRLQVNAEAYLYEYDKYQVQYAFRMPYPIPEANVPPTADAAGDFSQWIANADTGENYGLDLEIKALLTAKDQVDATFAYQHARYGDLVVYTEVPPSSTLPGGPPGSVAEFDLSGSAVANTPEWSATLGYQHSFDLPNGGLITARVQSKISDGYWATVQKHLDNAWQESYTKTDANISYTAPNETWFASAWVKNIEDDAQKTTIMPLYRMMISNPMTYGVNFTYRW